MKDLLIGLGLISCPAAVFVVFGTSDFDASNVTAAAPNLSVQAVEGRVAFDMECARCHGRLAEGTKYGPSLISPSYGPAALDDALIRRAVRQGVPARRWSFGDMPPVTGISERRLDRMITFVRALQRANGIR